MERGWKFLNDFVYFGLLFGYRMDKYAHRRSFKVISWSLKIFSGTQEANNLDYK